MTEAPLLHLEDVSHAFFLDRKKTEAQIALEHVSLSIGKGEFVSLIGPSGCGKTVTLSLMAGFMTPTMGTVTFKNAPICESGPERGVVFQDYSLLPWLSVKQNVMFALKNATKARKRLWNKAKGAEVAEKALAQVGLSDAMSKRPNTLSGGQRQRVAIARLIAMDSEVFLMDEPFSALDEQTRLSLDDSLFNLWQRGGKTIIFVTHSISEAVRISSRIVLFSRAPGRILHEWHVPAGMDRDPESEQSRQLSHEIRELMPLGPAPF